jgi:N-acetylglucosaminyldiphosphoundecaprenol N-acetyl-beta-D-mannosaminyltransferase
VIDAGKRVLLGVRLDAVDYEGALARILAAARAGQPLAVSALAVHGVMTGVLDAEQRWRINHLDLVTPDGQPVRWGLNLLYGTSLPDQVHGAVLTAKLLPHLEEEKIAVYWYGTTPTTLALLREELARRHPGLVIAGMEPSRFGSATPAELDAIAARIRACGAQICFVGLGCPRQETFVSAMRDRLGMPALAVGAAFTYLSGELREPPAFMRRHGLEWLWRLVLEPRRLWRRYVLLNPAYLSLLAVQRLTGRTASPAGREPAPDAPVPA